MIKLRIISRIDVDKNFFFDYLFAIYLLKEAGVTCTIEFIGSIYNHTIYNSIRRNARILDISHRIHFTEKSVPVSDLLVNENDYFVNASIGNFIGYSSIECLQRNFKTIFYNVDDQTSHATQEITFVNNTAEFVQLIKDINSHKTEMDFKIVNENRETLRYFVLDKTDKRKLENILIG